MDKPLISVIVPTHKRSPDLISKALFSVLKQSYKNLELIIVDDSPADFSDRSKVEKYIKNIKDDRVRYFQHESNYGANRARNTGIRVAKGEYCAFLDDDDEWIENKLELQLNAFTNSDIALVYCKAIVMDEKNKTVRPMMNLIKNGKYFDLLLTQNFIGSNSYVLIKSDIIREVGYFDESLSSNQDYDLFLRIAKKYDIAGVNEVLVKYYKHEGERITNNPQKQLTGRMLLYKKYLEEIKKSTETELIWRIKFLPLYYHTRKFRKVFTNGLYLLITHPIFFLRYFGKTLSYRKEKKYKTKIYYI